MSGTGGGGSTAPALSATEERLMAVYGWKSIVGDNNIELGLVSNICLVIKKNNYIHIQPSTTSQTHAKDDITTPELSNASPPPLREIVISNTSNENTASTKRKKQSCDNNKKKLQKVVCLPTKQNDL